ncbi:F-box LRR-repeat 6-like [Micractinium conductrix]|uniref:F-box LRR-repeat 6-like n=1 Tax=Micractinium conductrix TaxID=554055 RepID=A0A2P6VKS0_9CHLO|nr:F-box LRR-repeat 6-like [Micractinium conductrix]|eukprot:PSC74657.1 F-box LRR-repeat 6-like [Micractinium conductrix]
MAPKRGQRSRKVGLLGLELANSSDDDDYRPPGASSGAARRVAAAAAAAERTAEDVPLAQRRRQLVHGSGKQQAAASGAGASAAVTGPSTPCPDLPEEVLCHILRLACRPEAGGAIPTAAVAMCVSRSWRAAAEACPDLWHHISLSWRRCRPSDAALARAAPRWTHLRWLSLAGVAGVGDAGLQTLARCCPRLTSLSLAHSTQYSDRGLIAALGAMLGRPAAPGGSSAPLRCLDLSFVQVSPKVSGLDAVVREVLAQQARNPGGPALEELVIEGCPLLSHQGLRAMTEASVDAGAPLLAALRVLNLSQSAGARSDFVLNLERLQYSCPALQELRLNGLCGAYAWSFNATPSALPRDAQPPGFPQLTVCQVAAKANPDMAGLGTGATNVTDACLTRLLAQSPLLQELELSGCERLTPNSLATAVHPSAPLKHALLARSGACCDEAVTFLVDRFGATLEAVDLSWGGSRITDAAVAALARCPRLHSAGLAGTAVTTEGVRALLLAADAHAAAAAAQSAGSSGGGGGQLFHLDVSSCRGLERRVRQAATLDMPRLRAALGLG